MSNTILSKPLEVGASEVTRGQFEHLADGVKRIDPSGGKKGGGIIRGVSLITQGEALGHGVWADKEFVAQAVSFANAHERGLKSRFKHPSMSADGTGNYLGRFHDARLSADGTQSYADLHLDPAAHESPNGNLAEYVMLLADSDPQAFGMSIVFQYDGKAMEEFQSANQTEEIDVIAGKERKVKRWKSPDPENKANLPHARMKALRAADAVDSPAANPSGLFGDPAGILQEADALAAYVAGVSDVRPVTAHFDADPERLKEYFAKFLANSGLKLDKIAKPLTADQFGEELKRYKDRFGAELGCELLTAGLDWSAALSAWGDKLLARIESQELAATAATTKWQSDLAAAVARAETAERRLSEVQLGEPKPLSVPPGPSGSPPAKGRQNLSDGVAAYAAKTKLPVTA